MIWNDNWNDLESSFFDLSGWGIPFQESYISIHFSAEFSLQETFKLLVPVHYRFPYSQKKLEKSHHSVGLFTCQWVLELSNSSV